MSAILGVGAMMPSFGFACGAVAGAAACGCADPPACGAGVLLLIATVGTSSISPVFFSLF